jgi:hypothetical protein
MAIIATRLGGLTPCQGGPETDQHGWNARSNVYLRSFGKVARRIRQRAELLGSLDLVS